MINKLMAFIVLLSLIHCDRVVDKKTVIKNLSDDKEISYVFELKDTLLIGKTNKGIIYYTSALDTITNSFDDTINFRIVTFLLYEPRKLTDTSPIRIKDSLRIMTKEIQLESLKFKDTGKYIISGLITDVVLMNYFDAQGRRDSFRYLNKEQYVEKEVYVK